MVVVDSGRKGPASARSDDANWAQAKFQQGGRGVRRSLAFRVLSRGKRRTSFGMYEGVTV